MLGDRVMGRPQRCAGCGGRARSLTQPGAPWPGLLPVTAAGDWSSLPRRPTSRGRRGKPGGRLPSQAGVEWTHRQLPGAGRREGRGHLASGLCTDAAWCDSNKGASLGRGTRSLTWPLAPTRAYAHRRRLSSASRLTGAPSLVILLKRLWNLQLPAPLLTGGFWLLHSGRKGRTGKGESLELPQRTCCSEQPLRELSFSSSDLRAYQIPGVPGQGRLGGLGSRPQARTTEGGWVGDSLVSS